MRETWASIAGLRCRRPGVQHQRAAVAIAANLEHLYAEQAFGRGRQLQAQGSQRTAGGLAAGEVDAGSTAGFGGQLQPAQAALIDERGPADHGAASARGKRLFHGPQGIGAICAADDDEPGEIDAGRGERRCVGQMRRRHQRDPAILPRQARQRRHQQREFTDAGMRDQEFGERAAWPAAAGQQVVERSVSGGHARHRDLGLAVATPQMRTAKQNFQGSGHGMLLPEARGEPLSPAGARAWPPRCFRKPCAPATSG